MDEEGDEGQLGDKRWLRRRRWFYTRGASGNFDVQLFVRSRRFPARQVVAKADGAYVSSHHQRGWCPRTCTETSTQAANEKTHGKWIAHIPQSTSSGVRSPYRGQVRQVRLLRHWSKSETIFFGLLLRIIVHRVVPEEYRPAFIMFRKAFKVVCIYGAVFFSRDLPFLDMQGSQMSHRYSYRKLHLTGFNI